MVRDPLAKRFTKVDVRYVRTCTHVQLYPEGTTARVCMCASLLRISGTAGRTVMIFGVWVGD